MKIITYEGTVENGQIKLPETVHLPEHTRVFVVVPDAENISAARIYSPRLAKPEQASEFIKEVERFTIVTGDDGLPVIRTTNGVITSRLVKEIETQTA